MKKILISFTTIFLILTTCFSAFADQRIGPSTNGWVEIDGVERFYVNGIPANGWTKMENSWYYFNSDGHMLTGWNNINEKEYYLAETEDENHKLGACYINETTPDGFIVNENGEKTGVVEIPVRNNPYGRTCVEVDIDNQMVYVYIGNDLVLSTPCVSGMAGRHNTARGTFSIYSKERNRYLQGTNDNGTKYKSFVNFWMPFYKGQGLHDANWRTADPANYGGDIYTYNGSHGCVNMPYAAAEALYNIAYVGMPVYIH